MSEIERIMSQVVKKHCGDYDCILPEREIDNTDFYRGNSESCKKCAYNIILQALQEKAEREKQQEGCQYCRERKPLLNEIGDLQIDDTDATLWLICQSAPDDIFEEHTEIKFCPMCGRKLVKE